MKKNIFTFLTTACLISAPMQMAQAQTLVCPYGGSPSWNGQCETSTDSGDSYVGPPMSQEEANTYIPTPPPVTPKPTPTTNPTVIPVPSPGYIPPPSESPSQNLDTLPLPSQELINQNGWVSASIDPSLNDSKTDPISQDEPEIWAIVDANGNTLNTIVCDIDYCGSGWIPTRFNGSTPVEFARVVLQVARNPETGEYGGGHFGTYNFSTNVWTLTTEDGVVYEMPTEYGQDPVCIENCPIFKPYPDPDPESEEPEIPEEDTIVVQERKIFAKPSTTGNNVIVSAKINHKVLNNKVFVIAKKGNKKKVWATTITKKSINIKIPKKYLSWNISIRYVLG